MKTALDDPSKLIMQADFRNDSGLANGLVTSLNSLTGQYGAEQSRRRRMAYCYIIFGIVLVISYIVLYYKSRNTLSLLTIHAVFIMFLYPIRDVFLAIL
ncbi:hypothetical protein DL96DRAFT_1638282 [Flagelloscypha sp. PMI_526]|nr:hypothetical protein DL96DRAFT_1638282 [Flagelloscypha sp. PMI_526]